MHVAAAALVRSQKNVDKKVIRYSMQEIYVLIEEIPESEKSSVHFIQLITAHVGGYRQTEIWGYHHRERKAYDRLRRAAVIYGFSRRRAIYFII